MRARPYEGLTALIYDMKPRRRTSSWDGADPTALQVIRSSAGPSSQSETYGCEGSHLKQTAKRRYCAANIWAFVHAAVKSKTFEGPATSQPFHYNFHSSDLDSSDLLLYLHQRWLPWWVNPALRPLWWRAADGVGWYASPSSPLTHFQPTPGPEREKNRLHIRANQSDSSARKHDGNRLVWTPVSLRNFIKGN